MKGSIIKRGDKTYLLRLSLGKDAVTGKRLYHTETVHGTRKEAEARKRDLIRDFEQGRLVGRSTASLNEFLQQWLQSARQRLRERTWNDYGQLCRCYLEQGLGRLPLTKLTPMAIQKRYAELQERGLSAPTIRKLHVVLSQALKQAVRWRMLSHNPAIDVDLPVNRAKKVMRAMTLEQAQAFLEATQGQRWGPVLRFALKTGMRPEEYLALQWPDIDLNRGLVRITRVLVRPRGGGWKFEEPKTAGSRRTVALAPKDVEDLQAHRAHQLQERLLVGDRWETEFDFVFTNETGGPVSDGNLTKRVFKPALKRAGLSLQFRLYDLRHTCATLLLLGGENVKVVSERLGHAGVSITLDTYSHVLPTMQAGAAQTLSDLLDAPGPVAQPDPGPKVVSLQGRRRGS